MLSGVPIGDGSGKMNHQPQNENGQENLLDAKQVARKLKVSYGWIKDHATRKQPRLPCVRLGSLLRFRPQDIEEFIKSCCK